MPEQNPLNNKAEEYKKWTKVGFFGGDDYIFFVFKKTEKITSALYLVSGLLKDDEPIKWELREKGILLLSTSLSLNSAEPFDKNSLIQSLLSTGLETISLLNIAQIAGIMSDMNHSILTREIESIISLVRDRVSEDTTRAGYILSDSFFNSEDNPAQNISTSTNIGQRKNMHSQTSVLSSGNYQQDQKKYSTPFNDLQKPPQNLTKSIKDKKDSRKDTILSTLRKDSNLTVKDFSKVITDCSEKTIQRELLDLVDKGIIRKDGERRWSRYSLK